MPERPLAIALIIERFAPAKGGGAGYVAQLAAALVAAGHRVELFCAEAGGAIPGVRVHRVPSRHLTPGLRLARFAAGAARATAGREFDVIHAVGKAAGMNLYNPHGGVEQAWLEQHFRSIPNRGYRAWRRLRRGLSVKHRVILALQRRQFGDLRVRRIVAISAMVAADVARWYPDAAGRVRVVYNGVDLDRFSPAQRDRHRAAVRAREGAGERDLVLLHVGHNWRLKNLRGQIETLAALAARFPERPPLLWVLGRGRERPYRRLARARGVADRLRFLGARPDVEAYYAAADLSFHPTYYDACALATFEALASGLPVITTRANGAGGPMTDGVHGFADLEPDDLPALTAACAWFWDDARRAAAGRAARELMRGFSAADNAARIVAVYREIVAERDGTAAGQGALAAGRGDGSRAGRGGRRET